MCVEEGRREVPRGHWSPCWAQIVNEFLWRSQICPRIFSCVLLDMCSIHMYCVGRCTHVRQLLEVRLSVTPISESISERDKGGRAHMSWQESPFPSELGALLSRLSRLHRPSCLFDMLTICDHSSSSSWSPLSSLKVVWLSALVKCSSTMLAASPL